MIRQMRRFVTYLRIAGHVATAVAKITWMWPRWGPERQRSEVQDWSHGAMRIFGYQISASGKMAAHGGPAPLIVANHVSWLDIYAILAEVDGRFVAKSEVRRWPVVGWLAERLETLFLERDRRSSLAACVEKAAMALKGGRAVILFPEGTTSDGHVVLPFHASLFEAAIRAGAPVQPVAICYRRRDGTPASEAAFVGDMSLLASFQRLADKGGGSIELAFLPPIASAGRSRATLALMAERAIRDHLQRNVGVAADPMDLAA